jgi:hypothetical protein
VADAVNTEGSLGHAADGDDAPPLCERTDESKTGGDLGVRRPAVRRRRSRMGRHDVPEEDVVLDRQLPQDPVHDRRRRLRRAAAGELALRGERDPRDAGSAVARRLADEEDPGASAALEVRGEPSAQEPRPRPLGVLVERATDPSGGELVHEGDRRYDGTSVTGSSGQPG